MTWSSEPCDHWGITGHITAQGGQHRGDEACPDECHGNGWSTGGNSAGQDCATCECTPRCAPDDNTHAVRCCADADPTEAKAKCEAYVGYKGQLKNPPPASNTMDEIGREATTTAASALCQSSSSCYELQGLFGGWPVGATSDQIRAGQVTNAAGGYTHGGSQGYSTSGFNGNNNHLERHESGVCGESDNGLGEADEQGKRTNQCFGGEGGGAVSSVSVTSGDGYHRRAGPTGTQNQHHIRGWRHALEICQSVGSRLCTVEELLAENTRNTGCNHDCQMVWSSQTSPTCGANEHVVAQGGLNCAYMICPDECSVNEYAMGQTGQDTSCMCTPRCAKDTTNHAVRCCADVFFEQGVGEVDLTQDLPKGGCHL